MSDQRPYAALLAKGEDRRQRILAVAQRLLTANGWRNTTLGQIAREAGVTTAGLLHHFESKDQLLHAVLEVRDTYDDIHADLLGDIIEQIERVPERFEQMPEVVGTLLVVLVENLDPQAPLHDRIVDRYQKAIGIVAEGLRRGQRAGRYRSDVDADIKAVEIIAFINGMEASWLLDPSIPLADVIRGYAAGLRKELTVSPPRTPRTQPGAS